MYYKLIEEYGFRGFQNLPFAIQEVRGRNTNIFFFRKEEFRYLIKCNGVEKIEPETLPSEIFQIIKRLVELKIMKESENNLGRLLPYQRYTKYEARYIENVQWAITGKCNYRCRHCEVSAPEYSGRELPVKKIRRIIDEIAACGIRSIHLTGGEPLVRKDFEEILSYIHEKNLVVSRLYTNGALLDEKVLAWFDRYQMKPQVQISFDGKGHHDWIRGISGAEEKALQTFTLLKEKGYRISAAMMLHKKNKDSLLDTVRLLIKNGVSEVGVNAPKALGGWKEYAETYALSEEEVWRAYSAFIPKFYEEKMPVFISLDGYFAGRGDREEYRIPYVKKWEDGYDFGKMLCCKNVYKSLHIDPRGKVFPCMSFACHEGVEEKMPDIFEKSLADITLHSSCSELACYNVLDYLQGNKGCMDCMHRTVCRGGCYAQNVSAAGQPGIDKRTCYFFKNIGEEAVRKVVDEAVKAADH